MRNLYSCGCYVADDVPVVSRCGLHNGWVVCRHDCDVTEPQSLVVHKRLKIIHDNLYSVLPKLTKPLDFVFAYPDYRLFGSHTQLTPAGFANARIELFAHLLRLLRPTGMAVFILDVHVSHYCYYQAVLHGFDVHTRLAPVLVKNEPLIHLPYEERVYKMVLGLNTGPLPSFSPKNPQAFYDALGVPAEARILDISCILLDTVQRARPDSTILGIIEDATRYRRTVAHVQSALGVDTATAPERSSHPAVRKTRKK